LYLQTVNHIQENIAKSIPITVAVLSHFSVASNIALLLLQSIAVAMQYFLLVLLTTLRKTLLNKILQFLTGLPSDWLICIMAVKWLSAVKEFSHCLTKL